METHFLQEVVAVKNYSVQAYKSPGAVFPTCPTKACMDCSGIRLKHQEIEKKKVHALYRLPNANLHDTRHALTAIISWLSLARMMNFGALH